MTKDHAYLARIRDQEKDVIAVPDGAGRALCVSSDKHWTLTREWDELHIIAPLVEEAAVARTTPAVTREDVDEAVKGTLDGSNITLPDNLFDAQIDAVCRLFGVEAEPVDPVEAKARELWEVAQGDGPFIVWEALMDQERSMYRRMAAHVLGQEDKR